MYALLGEQNYEQLVSFFGSQQHAAMCVGEQLEELVPAITAAFKDESKDAVVSSLLPEKASITIDQIRSLKQSLVLKRDDAPHVLIIEQAETMTREAQNSFLKLLEEPPENVRIVLLARSKGALLSTITSRCRLLQVRKVGEQEAAEFYKEQGIEAERLRKAMLISRGRPGQLFALLSSEESYNELIELAKRLISQSLFERLTQIDVLVKDKDNLKPLLRALDDVLRAASRTSGISADRMRSITASRANIYHAQEALQKNTNAKLVMLDVFLGL